MSPQAATKFAPSEPLQPTPIKGPLSGPPPKRIVAFTHILAGPFCVANLRDLGAEVIVVESPTVGDNPAGDATRDYPGFLNHDPAALTHSNAANDDYAASYGGKQSLYHASLNSGNRSIILDLKNNDKDKETMRQLLASADVFVYNQTGPTMKKLGLDYEQIKNDYPHLIQCHISGDMYKEDGAYDLKAMADAGVLEAVSKVNDIQYAPGLSLADMTTGMEAAKDILAALLRRQECMERGEAHTGELIQVSMITAVRNFFRMMFAGATQEFGAKDPAGLGFHHPSIAPFASFKCGDGEYIVVCCGKDGAYRKFVECLGSPETLMDAAYNTNAERVEERASLKTDIEEALATKSAAQWLPILEKAGLVAALIKTPSEVVAGHKKDGNLLQYFREVIDRVTGKTLFLTPQIAMFEKDAEKYTGKDGKIHSRLATDPILVASTTPGAEGDQIRQDAGIWIGPSIESRVLGVGIPFVNDNGKAKGALLEMLKTPVEWLQRLSEHTLDQIAAQQRGIAA